MEARNQKLDEHLFQDISMGDDSQMPDEDAEWLGEESIYDIMTSFKEQKVWDIKQ